jgi:hypothetical protein
LFDVSVHAGQQVKILGENYTLEDEEDSRIGTVSVKFMIVYCIMLGSKNFPFVIRLADSGSQKQGEFQRF